MKKIIWITLMVIIGGYTVFRWDYHLSNYMFEKICNDKEKIGLFVYEQAVLDGEYLMPFPLDKEPRNLDPRFVYGDNRMINRDRFDQDYDFKTYEKIPVFEIGPITYFQSSVIRKSDNKLLGKVVSANNGRGWWMQKLTVSFGGGGKSCPFDPYGSDYSYFRRKHETLIKSIFTLTLNKGNDL